MIADGLRTPAEERFFLLDLNSFLQSYRGGISVEEGLELSRLAEACVNDVIVELGSFKGKSSVALAAGQAQGRFSENGRVYCIDPHLPFTGIYGGNFRQVDRRDFYTVMLETGLVDRVCLVNLQSVVAAGGWREPIGLLFIAGDHSIQAARTDVNTWEHHVRPGGTIVFDNALDPQAGAYAVIKQLLRTKHYEWTATVGKMVVLCKSAAMVRPDRPRGKRILVACHDIVIAGGLYRFERLGRVIQRFDHELAFVAFSDTPHTHRTSDFPVLTFEDAATQLWDATFVPGAGFPDEVIERFAALRSDRFGVRIQHILNDMTRRSAFLKVNRVFAPDTIIFNNRHWRPGDFTDFNANAFHILEGAVDLELFAPVPGATRQLGQPFVVGGLSMKNPDPLIAAVRLCGEDVQLRLFGPDGGVASRAPDLVESGQVKLVGVLDEQELPRFYSGVDCVAHTETFAGWANLVAEAMASGVPVICTPHGTGAFAEHEVTALLLSEPTPAALAGAILRLKHDPDFAIQMARNARQKMHGMSWTAYAADLMHLIKKPEHSFYTWSPDLELFGKWPEEQQLHGLQLITEEAAGATVCDLCAGDGLVSRRLLDRGAAIVHGFELDRSRVLLANRICAEFAGARFRQADLSDWLMFEAEHSENLRESYDIVLYLGLHHHLPADARMQVLAGAARRASKWLAVRTPSALFLLDGVETMLAELGFTMKAATSEDGAALGGSYIFTRNAPSLAEIR